MKLSRVLFIAIFIALTSLPALSQTATPRESAPSEAPHQTQLLGEDAPFVFWNRTIIVFRSYYDQISPAERAAAASERIEAIAQSAAEWTVAANEGQIGQRKGIAVTVNGRLVFVIYPEDLDPESNETLKEAADRSTSDLREALEARSQQLRVPVLLRGIGLSFVATLILLFGLWLLLKVSRRVLANLDQPTGSRFPQLNLGGLDLQPVLFAIERAAAWLTGWAVAITLVYVWLAFVLRQFPYSRPWGEQLGTFLINLLWKLGSGALKSIPGVFTVIVIFLCTRLVARVLSGILLQVEAGTIVVPWLHPDNTRATRRLLVILIWIFAVTVAYPYIPGSSTDAFKGVSVFVGLMISLGSAGLANQVMSGLVVIYSRALKPGEYVCVGDDFGTVSDVGMLSTKILTLKQEEITIPNAVLVGTKTVNYSRQTARVGTTLTIGYDAPWRQVHALLLLAAEQTAGIGKAPAPRVWQKALSDYYVEYELVVNLDQPEQRIPILSELHKHIQDAFNEHGVQIMSPHYEMQPPERVVVPKSQWFADPAKAPVTQNSAQEKITEGE